MIYLDNNLNEVDPNSLDYTKGYLRKEQNAFVYHLFTPVQLAERRIDELNEELLKTNEQAIQYADDILSIEDYAETKAQRQAWRDEINRLEQIINGGQ